MAMDLSPTTMLSPTAPGIVPVSETATAVTSWRHPAAKILSLEINRPVIPALGLTVCRLVAREFLSAGISPPGMPAVGSSVLGIPDLRIPDLKVTRLGVGPLKATPLAIRAPRGAAPDLPASRASPPSARP